MKSHHAISPDTKKENSEKIKSLYMSENTNLLSLLMLLLVFQNFIYRHEVFIFWRPIYILYKD